MTTALVMTSLPVVEVDSPKFLTMQPNFRIIDLLRRQLKDESLLESKLFEDVLLAVEGLQLIEFLESVLYTCLKSNSNLSALIGLYQPIKTINQSEQT